MLSPYSLSVSKKRRANDRDLPYSETQNYFFEIFNQIDVLYHFC